MHCLSPRSCRSVAFIGLFPLSWRWFEHESSVPTALAALITLSSLTFYAALDPERPRHVNVPSISLIGFAFGLGIVLTARWASRRPRRLTGVTMAVAMAVGGAWAPIIAARAQQAHEHDVAREAQERTDFARSGRLDSAARQAYLVTLAAEDAAGRRCERRRFFVLFRFDEPLMLQSPAFGNQVFHASRELNRTARAGPLEPCDYIIATPAVLETDKGTSLIGALAGGTEVETIGTAESIVIMRRREP